MSILPKYCLLLGLWFALMIIANCWQATAAAPQYLSLSRDRCSAAACRGGAWPYWQVVVLRERRIEQTIAAFVLGRDEIQFGPLLLPSPEELREGGFDGLGFVSHWDLEQHSFDPTCYHIDFTQQVQAERHLHFHLLSANEMVVTIAGKEETMSRIHVPHGFIVLNQHVEGDAENVVAAFSTEEVRSGLRMWEADCRAVHHVPSDAEWYCGKKHQLRLHVMAAVLLGPAQQASLPDPSQVQHITRRMEDRGDRRGLQNVSTDGFLGPLQLALPKGLPREKRDKTGAPKRMEMSLKLVEDVQEWYLQERTRSAYPGDSIFSGGYFGISSLLSSDVWILEVPDSLRLPLVDACRAAIMQWSGLAESDLDPYFAGHHARIYRGGSTCPLHVDRRPGDLDTLSCVYHAGSSVLSDHSQPDGSSAAASPSQQQRPYPAWPMDFESHFGRHHQVTFRSPGELVIYEASITPHGRLTDLMNDVEYVNIFIHFTRRSAARLRPDRVALHSAAHRARYLASTEEMQVCHTDLSSMLSYGSANSTSSASTLSSSSSSSSSSLSEIGRWEDATGIIVDEIESVLAPRWQLVGTLPVVGRRTLVWFKLNISSCRSLDYFLNLYRDVGLTFDRIVTVQRWHRIHEGPELLWRINMWDPENPSLDIDIIEMTSDNVVAFAFNHCRPSDFCVLFHESPALRYHDPLLRAILSTPLLLASVDELIWTYTGQDQQAFHHDIVGLREVGIRAHGKYQQPL